MLDDPKSATDLSEKDLRYLLNETKSRNIADGTYIPIRVSTPNALRAVVVEIMKRNNIPQSVIDKFIKTNNPMVSPVNKMRQAISPETEKFGNSHGHNMTEDDIIAVVEKMSDPEYIVYEEATDRYNEVIRYKNSKSNWVYAIVEINDNINQNHMNSYEGGLYNTTVTLYPVDTNQQVAKLISDKRNKHNVFDRQKIKALSQRTLGIQNVPAVLNDNAFMQDNDTTTESKSQEEIKKSRMLDTEYLNLAKEYEETHDKKAPSLGFNTTIFKSRKLIKS